MNKQCVCIKNWKNYNAGDEIFYITGKQWFVGGMPISITEFKEHFKDL